MPAKVTFHGRFFHRGPGYNFGYAEIRFRHHGKYQHAKFYINGRGDWVEIH